MIDPANISDELKEQAKACSTAEELVALANANGIELTDEDLNAISAAGEGCYHNSFDWKGSCTDDSSGSICCDASTNSVRRNSGKTGPLGLM